MHAPAEDLLRRAALRYAEAGWGVIPLHSPVNGVCDCREGANCTAPAKHPWTRHGLTDASTELAQIDAWWREHPEANIGLVLPPDIVAVDIDSPDALDNFDEHPDWDLPETWNVSTGRGWHYIYRTPQPVKGTAHVVPGIDLRGHGNYLVAPPSLHISGVRYRQNSSMGVIATAPSWVTNGRSAPGGAQLASDAPIPEGARNDTLTRLAGAMRRWGAAEDTILGALRAENARRVIPPLPDAELMTIARSVSRYAPDALPFRIVTDADRDPLPVGMDAADLLALNLPPLRWIVPELIPEGTTILAAPPKVGKSSLVYQLAVEVAIGGQLLGREVTRGSFLYLALEDGRRRGQGRLRTALAGRPMPKGRLEVRWTARRIGKGLEDDIHEWLDEHEDAVGVAIDTLQKVRPAGSGRRGAYEVDVEDMSRLQDLFRDRPTSLVIVHHARKATADDFLMSVSGTYGLTGSADTIVVVNRKRLEAFGTVTATGRDIEEASVSVRFENGIWEATAASLPEGRFERAEVYRIIEEQGPIFPKAIAEQLGKTRQSVAGMVDRMVDAGDVVRSVSGYQVAKVILSLVHDSAKIDV